MTRAIMVISIFAIMLAIAYASNFGGIATIIGTPPNVPFVGYFEKKYNTNIDFLDWMLVCTPLALLLMLSLYVVMHKDPFSEQDQVKPSGQQPHPGRNITAWKMGESREKGADHFLSTALLWICKDIINSSQEWFRLDDNIIAVMGAVALFICPAGQAKNNQPGKDKNESILEWEDTGKMAWGILLLFGGGLAMADALEKAGLIQQLGNWLGLYAGSGIILVLTVVIISIFISELMSNVAQVIVFTPVVCSLADSIGMNPLLLGMPMTLAASCASMLPMGTPPNAIVFASGHIKLKQMMKAGFVMNIVAIILITLFCWFILPVLMKVL